MDGAGILPRVETPWLPFHTLVEQDGPVVLPSVGLWHRPFGRSAWISPTYSTMSRTGFECRGTATQNPDTRAISSK